MPYIIKPVKSGFKVCKADDTKICFSKKGLPLKKAKKQKTAIILSELRATGKIPMRRKGKGNIFKPIKIHPLETDKRLAIVKEESRIIREGGKIPMKERYSYSKHEKKK